LQSGSQTPQSGLQIRTSQWLNYPPGLGGHISAASAAGTAGASEMTQIQHITFMYHEQQYLTLFTFWFFLKKAESTRCINISCGKQLENTNCGKNFVNLPFFFKT